MTYAQRNLRFRLAHFSYWYNDFGEVEETKASGYSSFVNEVQYTGGIYDNLTGLLYLNARFYDPQTGRFISRDTYRGEQDNAGTWHLYAYCANNPVNYVDPSGHFAYKFNKSKKTISVKISFVDIGVVGTVTAMLSYPKARSQAKKVFWKKIVKQLPKEMVKRSIPVYGIVMFTLSLAVAGAESRGYRGVKYSMIYGTKKIKKHQGGRIVTGRRTYVKSSAKLYR